MAWLAKHGIAKARLYSQGFRAEPIDTNASEEGRKNNRRVEFHIEKEGGYDVGGAAGSRRRSTGDCQQVDARAALRGGEAGDAGRTLSGTREGREEE